jgi:hypothetical protein
MELASRKFVASYQQASPYLRTYTVKEMEDSTSPGVPMMRSTRVTVQRLDLAKLLARRDCTG